MAKRKRDVRVVLQFTEDEKAILLENVEKSKSGNTATYARKMLLDGMVVNVDLSAIEDLTVALNRIGSNINQIARVANETRSINQSEIEEVKRLQKEIWQLQKSTLSKLVSLNR